MNSIVKIFKILTYIPLFIIFKFKRTINIKSENNDVLIITLSRIGDTVFLSFALSILYEKYTQNITVLCYKNSESILKIKFPFIKYISINNEDVFKGRFISKKVISKIDELNPGKIYDLTGSVLAASILFHSKAKNIIGFNERYFNYLYTKFFSVSKKPHLVDLYLRPVLNDFPDIKISKEFNINFNPLDKILIFPFGGWKAKEWNIEKFIQLQNELNKNIECKFIMERNLFSSNIFNKNDVILTNSIEELINELRNCSLIISNDSGPLYIANMLGKPTFSIYGPTNPNFSLPYGIYHTFIKSNIHCIPEGNNQYCHTDGGRNGCKKFICMDELSFEEVYKKVNNFIEFLNITNKKEVVIK